MIMPGPARRHVDLEGNLAAQALTGGGLAGRNRFALPRRQRIKFVHCTPQAGAISS
jgi:hypothetical protein